ncbi:kelch-like ECH-associated protein 1 [Paramacrobiotus metropolitanus]|uniref:kelch-like ECH-associated protein 1 n=1 Tax=Paramacrobiotus metropolitanus TaxID=2943436 RepID=UPI0024459237|nr:kelch-like ECH-associated protein 1 [Paramacrobiotus metropolitanus]
MFHLGPALPKHCFVEIPPCGMPVCEVGDERDKVVMDGKHYFLDGSDLYVHDVYGRENERHLPSPEFRLTSPSYREFEDAVTFASYGNIYMYNGLHFARYDVRLDEWEDCPLPTGTPRGRCDMIELNGYLYVTGGYDNFVDGFDSDTTVYSTECDRYHLETGEWQSIAPMHNGRCERHLCVVDGQLVAVGRIHPKRRGAQGSVERYHAESNVWTDVNFVLPGASSTFRISQFFVAEVTCIP